MRIISVIILTCLFIFQLGCSTAGQTAKKATFVDNDLLQSVVNDAVGTLVYSDRVKAASLTLSDNVEEMRDYRWSILLHNERASRDIRSSNDLVGVFKIDSPKDVSQLCKLVASELSRMIGLRKWPGWYVCSDGYVSGVDKTIDFDELGLANEWPLLNKTDDGWIITYLVVREDFDGPASIRKLTALVRPNSSYLLINETVLAILPKKYSFIKLGV